MESSELLKIAGDWSYWDGEPPPSVGRRVELPEALPTKMALVIQGVRRCGKSTLLGQLLRRYGLDHRRCLFLNFEDPRLAGALTFETLQAAVDAFEAERGSGCTWFFDEIQHVDGWQRWLRTQLDLHKDRHFVITGSNAHLLSGELGSSLTGRQLSVELFPFSFEEYLELKAGATVSEYLHDGGFPAPLQSPDSDRILASYFNDILERDVRERVGARSIRPLRQLGQMLFESAGSELSIRRVAGALGVATDTASLYLGAIESAYLAFACPFFVWSERKRSIRNKKYYPIDTGLRRMAITRTGKDRGKMLECASFTLLRKRFVDVYYWRGKGEIDFVVMKEGAPVPIQVSWDAPADRHLQAVEEFHRAEPRARDAVFISAESYADGLPELQA